MKLDEFANQVIPDCASVKIVKFDKRLFGHSVSFDSLLLAHSNLKLRLVLYHRSGHPARGPIRHPHVDPQDFQRVLSLPLGPLPQVQDTLIRTDASKPDLLEPKGSGDQEFDLLTTPGLANGVCVGLRGPTPEPNGGCTSVPFRQRQADTS